MNFAIESGELRLLDTNFTRKGIEYREVASEDTYRVFSARLSGEGREWFEAFQRRVNAPHEINGVKIPASEAFPPDSAFGVWAFTFPSLDQAVGKGRGFSLHKSVSA